MKTLPRGGGWTRWYNIDAPNEHGDNEMISDILAKHGIGCHAFQCTPEEVIVAQVQKNNPEAFYSPLDEEEEKGCSIFNYDELPTTSAWLYGTKRDGKLVQIDGEFCMGQRERWETGPD